MNSRFMSIAKDMIYRFKDDNVTALSSQLSYSIVASFFPFLIFLMTLAANLNIDERMVLDNLSVLLPREAFDLIRKTVVEVLGTKSPHLLSFSLILAIWSSATGVRAVIHGLNKAYDEPEKRAFYKLWIVSIVGTIVMALALTLTLVLLIFGGLLGNFAQCCYKFSNQIRLLWDILRFILSIFILILIFATSYHLLPSRRLRWKEAVPGALFSTFGWIFASLIFSYYVNNFSNYSRFYGSIGAVFVLMTWLYISSVIIILGGELNATLIFSKLEKEAEKNSSK